MNVEILDRIITVFVLTLLGLAVIIGLSELANLGEDRPQPTLPTVSPTVYRPMEAP